MTTERNLEKCIKSLRNMKTETYKLTNEVDKQFNEKVITNLEKFYLDS